MVLKPLGQYADTVVDTFSCHFHRVDMSYRIEESRGVQPIYYRVSVDHLFVILCVMYVPLCILKNEKYCYCLSS